MGRLRIIQGRRKAQPFYLSADERAAIEWEIERLIASLDLADGDDDLEDDDPSGDPLDVFGEPPSDDASTILPTLPVYAINQSLGPINRVGAVAAYLDQQEGR